MTPNGAAVAIAGRYVIGEPFASGGMGAIHLGRVHGAGGFARTVAVKRLFPGFANDAAFREMLLDEARLVSRIRHPNVVPTLDVWEEENDLYVVMEYVHGVSLARLLKRCDGRPIPVGITLGILECVLSGLHAAHEARSEDGTPLGMVHRDVSPQNILVGADGVVRLIDFGIAKAATGLQVTDPGVVKGKRGYMAPEQILGQRVSRQADIFAASAVLWEALTHRTLLDEHGEDAMSRRITTSEDVPPSRYREEVSDALDAIVLRGLAHRPGDRFPTAEAMASAIRKAEVPAAAVEIAEWVRDAASDELELSEERVRLFEQSPDASSSVRVLATVPASGPSLPSLPSELTSAVTRPERGGAAQAVVAEISGVSRAPSGWKRARCDARRGGRPGHRAPRRGRLDPRSRSQGDLGHGPDGGVVFACGRGPCRRHGCASYASYATADDCHGGGAGAGPCRAAAACRTAVACGALAGASAHGGLFSVVSQGRGVRCAPAQGHL